VNGLTNRQDVPYKLSKIKGGTDIVLIFDGTQYFNANGLWNGNAHPVRQRRGQLAREQRLQLGPWHA
jgi:hypothetical protein